MQQIQSPIQNNLQESPQMIRHAAEYKFSQYVEKNIENLRKEGIQIIKHGEVEQNNVYFEITTADKVAFSLKFGTPKVNGNDVGILGVGLKFDATPFTNISEGVSLRQLEHSVKDPKSPNFSNFVELAFLLNNNPALNNALKVATNELPSQPIIPKGASIDDYALSIIRLPSISADTEYNSTDFKRPGNLSTQPSRDELKARGFSDEIINGFETLKSNADVQWRVLEKGPRVVLVHFRDTHAMGSEETFEEAIEEEKLFRKLIEAGEHKATQEEKAALDLARKELPFHLQALQVAQKLRDDLVISLRDFTNTIGNSDVWLESIHENNLKDELSDRSVRLQNISIVQNDISLILGHFNAKTISQAHTNLASVLKETGSNVTPETDPETIRNPHIKQIVVQYNTLLQQDRILGMLQREGSIQERLLGDPAFKVKFGEQPELFDKMVLLAKKGGTMHDQAFRMLVNQRDAAMVQKAAQQRLETSNQVLIVPTVFGAAHDMMPEVERFNKTVPENLKISLVEVTPNRHQDFLKLAEIAPAGIFYKEPPRNPSKGR